MRRQVGGGGGGSRRCGGNVQRLIGGFRTLSGTGLAAMNSPRSQFEVWRAAFTSFTGAPVWPLNSLMSSSRSAGAESHLR